MQTSCWRWTRATSAAGYAQVRHDGKTAYVHRLMYEDVVGPIPDGLELDHLCRTRNCVNPEHLEPVTHAENMRRGYWSIKTHCPHGHEYTEENTKWKKNTRECKTCHRNRERARYASTRTGRARSTDAGATARTVITNE